MKDFVFNTALGRRFFAEFCTFAALGNIKGKGDFYEDVYMVMFEENLSLSVDNVKQLIEIAYRYNLNLEFRAESDSLIVEFCKI